MKHLFKAFGNGMDYYFVEDFASDLAICVDWDLSEEEENELILAFENETLDFTANGCNWESTDSAYGSTFGRIRLA